jgi:hypothetical protein
MHNWQLLLEERPLEDPAQLGRESADSENGNEERDLDVLDDDVEMGL